MDTNKIFLLKNNSLKATNTSPSLHVPLLGKSSFLPSGEIFEHLSSYDVYMDERSKCEKIRLTAQVNVVATNVLFNDITEIVKDEGSDSVILANYEGNPLSGSTMRYYSTWSPKKEMSTDVANERHCTNAIRDTSSSNEGFVYHCGRDIFNNHVLRSTTYKNVQAFSGQSAPLGFNTIGDMLRDVYGNEVKETVYYPQTANKREETKSLHLYKADEILDFNECVETRLVQKYNGWVGFDNRVKMLSYKDFDASESLNVNKVLMNHGGGDFIDMYPSRDLFTFVPKYNQYKNRIEKNWECCITYPCSSITNGDFISGDNGFLDADTNSMRCIYFNENTFGDNGVKQIVFYSIAKHGLSVGDYVNIYVFNKDGEGHLLDMPLQVYKIVDDYIFVVSNDTISISSLWFDTDNVPNKQEIKLNDTSKANETFVYDPRNFYVKASESASTTPTKYYVVENRWVNLSDEAYRVSFKKVNGGVECSYYVRIFSRLPNFKFANGEISRETLYPTDGSDSTITDYIDYSHEFESHQSKMAFAKNIYSDSIGQVVFTDDISIEHLKDNLGRPLTSLYLSFFKTNYGYKEWYGFDNTKVDVKSDNVEFSHCFGRLTCAFDLSDESRVTNAIPSIKNINNIDRQLRGLDCSSTIGNTNTSKTSVEIDFRHDLYFYGDLAYYDNYDASEHVIQPILHRFGTAQRECYNAISGSSFYAYNIDEIKSDDFDTNGEFVISTLPSSQVYFAPSNMRKEGYYYEPHHEIRIRSFDELLSVYPDFLTIRSLTPMDNAILEVHVLNSHFLSNGDETMLMYTNAYGKRTYYTLKTIKPLGEKAYICNVFNDKGEQVLSKDEMPNVTPSSSERLNYKLFKLDNIEIPAYARVIDDGSCRVLWRNVASNGSGRDKTLEEYPFTNGALYVNKGINLFVRRQDPESRYGLYADIDLEGKPEDILDLDIYVKEDEVPC